MNRRRRAGALVRRRLVGCFLLAPEHHGDPAFRVEPHDHVRALVDRPDVVVAVDPHRMRERPGIKVLADLADEGAVRPELEQLRGGRAVGRPRGVAAREDEYVALRIDRDAGHLAEVEIGRELDRIGHRLERNFRHRLLGQGGRDHKDEQSDQPTLHGFPPLAGRQTHAEARLLVFL